MANLYLYCNGDSNHNKWMEYRVEDDTARLYSNKPNPANVQKIPTENGRAYFIKVDNKYLKGHDQTGDVTVENNESRASKWIDEVHSGPIVHIRLYDTADNLKTYLRGKTAEGKKGELEMRKDEHAAKGTQWIWEV